MERVEEIETAIASLPPEDYQTRLDEQIHQDSISGKLDFLFEEAERAHQQGLTTAWPSVK